MHNLVSAPGEVGRRAKEKVKAEGGVEVLRAMVVATREKEVMTVGVEVLKLLG